MDTNVDFKVTAWGTVTTARSPPESRREIEQTLKGLEGINLAKTLVLDL